MKIAYILNDAAFFVSHRLPLALSVIKQGGEVVVITGKNINKALEDEANGDFELANNAAIEGINDVEKLLINHTEAV